MNCLCGAKAKTVYPNSTVEYECGGWKHGNHGVTSCVTHEKSKGLGNKAQKVEVMVEYRRLRR